MKKQEILLFEDDPEVSQVLTAVLSKEGHSVRSSLNGRMLRKFCETKLPDLVITDVYMPGKDGLEVIRELRRSFPTVKIIAMSGKPAPDNLLFVAERLGAHLACMKPFDFPVLLKAINDLLKSDS